MGDMRIAEICLASSSIRCATGIDDPGLIEVDESPWSSRAAVELDGRCWTEAEEGGKCLTALWPLRAPCDLATVVSPRPAPTVSRRGRRRLGSGSPVERVCARVFGYTVCPG